MMCKQKENIDAIWENNSILSIVLYCTDFIASSLYKELCVWNCYAVI